jgi:hypothetical protein
MISLQAVDIDTPFHQASFDKGQRDLEREKKEN